MKSVFSWTSYHTEFLRSNINLKNRELASIIGCSYGQINLKKHQLGLCKPSYKRVNKNLKHNSFVSCLAYDDFLIENNSKLTNKQLCEHFNISASTLYVWRSRLGLIVEPQFNRRFTLNEIAFIVENFEAMSIKNIGVFLGRSSESISIKAHSMGLFKLPRRNKHDSELLKELKR